MSQAPYSATYQNSFPPSAPFSIPRQQFETTTAQSQRQPVFGRRFGQPGLTQFLEGAAVPIVDDDYYDILPEEEEEEDVLIQSKTLTDVGTAQRNQEILSQLFATNHAILQEQDPTAFQFPWHIDTYRPDYAANPLKNGSTAQLFGYFITSTAPMISVFVRGYGLSSLVVDQGQLAPSDRGLWTYTLPMMAMYNQGLLHAMLAMASLQIAKTQGSVTTPSAKHYGYSLRRIHKAVNKAKHRHAVTTLAATLLLAFYEVGTADHHGWSTHLSGARFLIENIDFARMTREVHQMRERRGQSVWAGNNAGFGVHPPLQPILGPTTTVDSQLLQALTGLDLEYDQYGRGTNDSENHSPPREFSTAELNNFEILQDLFWWYARHEIIHALVGGGKLQYVPLPNYCLLLTC